MKKTSALILTLLVSCFTVFAISCDKDPQNNTNNNTGGGGESKEDIQVVDGKVKFFIEVDSQSPRSATSMPIRLTKVLVNGKEYEIQKDTDGKSFVEVNENNAGEYNAVYVNSQSQKWYGRSANIDLKMPYSQVYLSTLNAMRDFPMYASYTKETGNRLVFKDAYAMLDIAVTGDAKLTSINVSTKGASLAGYTNYKPSLSALSISKGLPFVELNCGNNGDYVALSESAKHFMIPVCPGNYPNGLHIRICDAEHKMMEFKTESIVLAPNQILALSKEYKPEEDLLFFEGFDTFVWGGDYMAGSKAVSFAPIADKVGIDYGKELTGYEDSMTEVSYDSPGTGFIQPNDWSACSENVDNPRTVASVHQMSESYVKSRALGDFVHLFRCQERPGYVEVGAANNARGILRTGRPVSAKGIIKAKYEFDICLKHDFNDDILVQIINGGMISSCKIDGKAVDLKSDYLSYTASLTIPQELLTKASAEQSKKWNHIELELDGASSATSLYLTSLSSADGKHGFYLDNLKMTKLADIERGNLRVLSWNIQNGMWGDQHNNYDNFVAWVKSYDPDICIWCEAETIYMDNTNKSSSTRFLPAGWETLAARYGHQYVARSGDRDNYSQVVTSKYPLTTIKKFTDSNVSGKPISHGAGLHSVNVNGKEIYVVTLHTWPQSYAYGVSSANQAASTAEHGGDYYRQFEMNYVVEQTKNNPAYAAQKDWIFAGDFNSRSRQDNWYYKYEENNTLLITQDVILENTDYVDMMVKAYPGKFVTSTMGNSRIDYVYMSPSLSQKAKNVFTIMDDWTCCYRDQATRFCYTSDHRPILVDLNY